MSKRTSSDAGFKPRYKKGNVKRRRYRRSQVTQREIEYIRKTTGEKKGMDTDIDMDVIATTTTNGSAFVLNLIQQGNGSWNRVGRKVCLKSVRIKANAKYLCTSGAGNLVGSLLRIVVVWDKQPSGGTLPTFDTIFGRTDQTGAESTEFLDSVKYDNMSRFSVLRDITVDARGTPSFSEEALQQATLDVDIDEYIKLGNKETVYLGQSSPMTIADVSTGGLYLYARSSNYVDGSIEWSLSSATSRLRYTD